jgi:xanthine dehydrogenase accessory factor
MTPSFHTDIEALVSLLNAVDRPPFIGLMGSEAKKQRIRRRLAEIGLDLEHVHCPVGLEMRSETPEEIAVSVAGQLLRSTQ